ncbi:MAG: YbgC/FadM family acyl-CoA thioesterase [Candidatus Margulisiibacteriota bacterium]
MKNEIKYRVIYQDTDAEGVVYYANYLGLFERGRVEFMRQAGISLTRLKEKQGIVFAVIKVDCDYIAPAFFDDELTITTEIEKTTPVRIAFVQKVLRETKLLVSAKISVCSLDIKAMRPVKLPDDITKLSNSTQ